MVAVQISEAGNLNPHFVSFSAEDCYLKIIVLGFSICHARMPCIASGKFELATFECVFPYASYHES